MEDKLFFGARSSLFASPGMLALFGALTVVCGVFRQAALCAACAFLLILGTASRLWGTCALRQVEARGRAEPAALFPPGEVSLRLSIQNKKLLPLIWLEIVQLLDRDAPLIPADPGEVLHIKGRQAELAGAKDGEADFLYKKITFVTGREELIWESRWLARRRGIFRPDELRLRSGDGFGLTQEERTVSGGGQCVAVYPAVQGVSTDLFLQDMWEAASGARGHQEDLTVLKSTRDYTPSDPARRINWRLTARSGKVAVNTYETILPKSAHFILDGESFNGPGRQSAELEDTLSILTSLLLRLDRSGIRCSMSFPKSLHMPARVVREPERTPLEEILYAMADYQLLDLICPEEESKTPYALPSAFLDTQILALRDVGRFYYVCASLERVEAQGLASRLDSARTTFLPYTAPAARREDALRGFPVVGLCTLKRGERNA